MSKTHDRKPHAVIVGAGFDNVEPGGSYLTFKRLLSFSAERWRTHRSACRGIAAHRLGRDELRPYR